MPAISITVSPSSGPVMEATLGEGTRRPDPVDLDIQGYRDARRATDRCSRGLTRRDPHPNPRPRDSQPDTPPAILVSRCPSGALGYQGPLGNVRASGMHAAVSPGAAPTLASSIKEFAVDQGQMVMVWRSKHDHLPLGMD
ncbi:hypothetical protein Prum_047060 [Phytohabitans rumicis]|uniref:Uncharacterized protein n=1 Tax=Phytohabitans rumicis TaxID=1076125 RepID=A0A6V8L4C5_9ACTN|nr:hypothetical protein Prum_047060 [Phytohabitans rumicis]